MKINDGWLVVLFIGFSVAGFVLGGICDEMTKIRACGDFGRFHTDTHVFECKEIKP